MRVKGKGARSSREGAEEGAEDHVEEGTAEGPAEASAEGAGEDAGEGEGVAAEPPAARMAPPDEALQLDEVSSFGLPAESLEALRAEEEEMRRVDAQVEAKLHAKNELEACVLGLGLGLGSNPNPSPNPNPNPDLVHEQRGRVGRGAAREQQRDDRLVPG